MIEDHLQEQHDKQHEETLESLKDTDKAIELAQNVLSEAREKLKKATKKYEERLYGPEPNSNN